MIEDSANIPKGVWVNRYGEWVPIVEMKQNYIENAIRCSIRACGATKDEQDYSQRKIAEMFGELFLRFWGYRDSKVNT